MERPLEGWTVYIIETESGKLYTGITKDLNRRFEEHQNGRKGAQFFHLSKAKKILWIEHHPTRSVASKRESQIKKMARSEKLTLIGRSRTG